MIEYQPVDFATQYPQGRASLLAAGLPAVFFATLGITWFATNNWLAGFVFLFTGFVALGTWWEQREIRAITTRATQHARGEDKILLRAHYAEIHRRTPDLLRGALIIAAVVPAIFAFA